MEFFKQWAISICACGIIGTVFSMIAPKGSMEKILNLVIAVFILTSVLLPFLKIGDIKLDFEESNFSNEQSLDELVNKSNEITLNSSKASVEKAVMDFLESNDILGGGVSAIMENDAENNLKLKLIKIYLSADMVEQSENVRLLVKNKFETDTEVFSSGDFINE